MPTYFNVVTRPYCVDIIRLYLHHLVIVLQYVLSVASITFSVYFHPKIYSFDVNEIYPVFDSDLCVYRCCVCILPRAIRLVSSSGESNLITYKSLDIV